MSKFKIKWPELANFKEGDDPEAFLEPGDISYSVYDHGKPNTVMTITPRSTGSPLADFADRPDVAAAIDKAANASPGGRAGASTAFLVYVRQRSWYFIGRKIDNTVILTPTSDILDFKADVAVPAARVFAAMAPIAKREAAEKGPT